MRSAAQVQKDINRALKESGGAWTSQLNALVAERTAARSAEKGGSIPRQTTIMGEPHRLAYINPVEERVLRGMGGSGAPVGPGGVPAYFLGTASGSWGMDTKTFDTPAGTKTVSTTNVGPNKTVEVKTTAELRAEQEAKDAAAAKAAQDKVNEILAQQNDRDDRAPAGTYTGTGVTLGGGTAGGSSAGTTQSTGEVAGETALERRRRLTVERNQALAAERAAAEAAALAAAAEEKRLKDLAEAAAAAEAKRKKAEAEAAAAAAAAAEKKRLDDQAAAAAAAEAKRKKAEAEAAATKAAEEAAAKAAADAAAKAAADAAAAIDFTTTATGRPYEEVAGTEQSAVSGAEAALGTFAGGTQDTGVTEGDFPIYAGSFGEDLGVTPGYSFNPETGRVEANPVVDLGGINITPETDYSYDPLADVLQSQFEEMTGGGAGAVVTDPVAEALARERAAAEAAAAAARTKAALDALDAQRRATGVQPGLTIPAYTLGAVQPGLTTTSVDPFGSTALGPPEARGRTGIFEASRETPSIFERNLGLGPMFTSGVGTTLQLLGNVGQVLTGNESAPVGYGTGEVDPRLASAVDRRMAEELGYIPTNLPPSDLFNYFEDMAGAGEVLRERAVRNAPTEAQKLYTAPFITEEGFDFPAFLVQGAATALPTLFGLAGTPLGRVGAAVSGAGLTAGEVALEARQQAEARATASGYSPEQAEVIGQVAAERAAGPGAVVGGLSNVLFNPLLGSRGIMSIPANAVEEALTEGIFEPSTSQMAALSAMGEYLPDQPFYGATGSMNEAILGAAGGALLSSIGAIPAAPSVPAVPASVAQPVPPFIPAPPAPGFTPGAGPAATMTVEGTATDVTPGFRPTGPTVGQIAQTPPGLLTEYERAADTLGEAGVRNIGGAPATMMDIAAATEIINNEIAETGGLSQETALNLERATGLSATAIRDIAETAPRVGTARDTLITDVVTGTGGGGQIQVTSNPNGTYTLKNLTTGNPQHVATVEPGQNLDEAIKVFDEVTTVGSPGAIRVDSAGTATLPPAQLTREPAPYTSPAAEPTSEPTTRATTPVPVPPARPTSSREIVQRDTSDSDAGTGIASLEGATTGTQVSAAEPVDLTETPTTVEEIVEAVPVEDVIEGTAVEIAGQIPGTTAVTTTPVTTSVATTTDVSPATTSVTTVADEEEEEPPAEDLEEEPGDGGEEEPETEVTIEEAVEEEEEPTEEPPFECPDGYTAVKLAGRWTCQKTETTQVGRPTIGTRPYLSRVGFAGPSPYRPSTRTVTRTVTAAE